MERNHWTFKWLSLKVVDALKMPLEAKKVVANVYVAMRYWHPFTEEVVQ
ncbi:putative protoporphyrin ferrochelatase [Helianthus annuus]|uniref:Protoporphyrin ferrochelatase n=1 Tax=Helianthus annuus TaxID=4232 RepID=A0A9K3E2V0_HELAN|nr:putative protoporphyrin ferrochelatase [Helianthus annuus]